MHTINLSFKGIRTDLISDQRIKKANRQKKKRKRYYHRNLHLPEKSLYNNIF